MEKEKCLGFIPPGGNFPLPLWGQKKIPSNKGIPTLIGEQGYTDHKDLKLLDSALSTLSKKKLEAPKSTICVGDSLKCGKIGINNNTPHAAQLISRLRARGLQQNPDANVKVPTLKIIYFGDRRDFEPTQPRFFSWGQSALDKAYRFDTFRNGRVIAREVSRSTASHRVEEGNSLSGKIRPFPTEGPVCVMYLCSYPQSDLSFSASLTDSFLVSLPTEKDPIAF